MPRKATRIGVDSSKGILSRLWIINRTGTVTVKENRRLALGGAKPRHHTISNPKNMAARVSMPGSRTSIIARDLGGESE
jgi:hypothetical protein